MEWSNEKLGDYCEVIAGQSPEGKYYNDKAEGLPFYQGKKEFGSRYIGEPKKWTTKVTKKARAGDILMSVRAPVGPINFSTQDICIGRGLAAIRPIKELNQDFLFYYLLSKQEEITGNEGAVFASINKAQIEALSFSYVSLDEQKRIVAILDQAFAEIDQARANAQQKLNNARELFESYLQQIFSQRGEGWVSGTLSELCQIKPPKKEAKELLNDNDLVSFVPMNAMGIKKKDLNLDQNRELKDVTGSYTYFAENDVLLAKITPCFENGKLGLARGLTNGVGFGSSEYIVFRCGSLLDPDFLYYYLSQQEFIDKGKKLMSGAVGHKRVSKDFIAEHKIFYPSLEQQLHFVAKIEKLALNVSRIEQIYQNKLDNLDQLKKSILQKAFTGELTKENKGVAA